MILAMVSEIHPLERDSPCCRILRNLILHERQSRQQVHQHPTDSTFAKDTKEKTTDA